MRVIDRIVRNVNGGFDQVTFQIDTVSSSEASLMADQGKFDLELSRGLHDPKIRPYGVLPHIEIRHIQKGITLHTE